MCGEYFDCLEMPFTQRGIRAMNHDPKYFSDPEVFRPERHLDVDGNLRDPVPNTHGYSHGTFGSGRRYVARGLETPNPSR